MTSFDRFAEGAQDAAAQAYDILHHYGHNVVDTEHFLLALLEQPRGQLRRVLNRLGTDQEVIKRRLDELLRASPGASSGRRPAEQVSITPRVKHIVDLANQEANRLRDERISTEHLFLAILSEQNTAVARILGEANITKERFHIALKEVREEHQTAARPVTCFASGCAHSPSGHCAQCGRAHCDQHGGQRAGYGSRCRECYAQMLQGFVVTHHLAERLPEALSLLSHLDPAGLPPEGLFYHGWALAAGGDLDAAVDRLGRLLPGNDASGAPAATAELARQVMGKTLSSRAARRLQSNDALGAVEDLHRAAALLDDNGPQRAALSALVHQSALAYFRAGRLAEALQEWEQAQARDPQDVQVIHHLAVVCYRLASEQEAQNPSVADIYWKKAIACWIVVLTNPDFLSAWAQNRASVVGPIDANLLAGVRQDLENRLRTEFSDCRARYLERKQTEHASRHAAYEVEFLRERVAAQEMLEAMQRSQASRGVLHIACGPLMLARWQEIPAAAGLVEATRSLASASPTMARYFSPLGRYYVMVRDTKPRRYEAARIQLEKWLKQNPNDNEAKALLVEALLKGGQELQESGVLDRAVEWLEEGARYNVNHAEILPALGGVATRYARTLREAAVTKRGLSQQAQADNNTAQAHALLQEASSTTQRAMDLLERIQRAYPVRDSQFTAELAQLYFLRGLVRSDRQEHQAALDDLRKALEIDPSNQAARDNLATVLRNRGVKRANDAMQAHAFRPWDTRQRLLEALEDLRAALTIDPGNWDIQQQIDAVNNMLRQLR